MSTNSQPAPVQFPKVAQLKSVEAFRAHLHSLGAVMPVDDEILSAEQGSPLAEPMNLAGRLVGNRWCIHPMEGWDANADGSPSEKTVRRWRQFGLSGAKLIWGGEAAAVQPAGRANPNQTLATESNRAGLELLLAELLSAHRESFGSTDDLLVGLQLTDSGRFSKPRERSRSEPRIAFHHPLLDAKFGIDADDESVVLSDDQLDQLADDYVSAARLAAEVGFQFVDVKACHGYLLHELLSARSRDGKYGGSLAGRTRLLTEVIGRIRRELPDLIVGVRLSVFDFVPYATSSETGQPMDYGDLLPYQFGFGVDPNNPLAMDLTEPIELLRQLADLGVAIVNLSCGSPYYNPHIQRPASFAPSDGYLPPEDPLVGVWRQLDAVRQCKQAIPDLPMVGSGYSYLQDYLPHVAQAVVRENWVDFVGVGRMVLSYPELPADTLAGRAMQRKRICRTFSDCTTAPRNGLVSGCYPLDPYYKAMPERKQLQAIKKKQ